MSHFTKINAQVKDLEILKIAAKKMGLDVKSNEHCRYYSGSQIRDAVVVLPGAYDVGLTQNEDHYDIDADFYNGHVEKYVGPKCGDLLKNYAAEKARIEAFSLGLGVTEEVCNNEIVLTMTDSETGGQIKVECQSNGNVKVQTSGFSGQGCMKFKSLEEALGVTQSISYTEEFYAAETEKTAECLYTTIEEN